MIKQFLIALVILTSCQGNKLPLYEQRLSGTIITCSTDSTFLTTDTLIRIKKSPHCKQFCVKYKNPNCTNRPDYIDFVEFWPSDLILDFKDNLYTTLHSPRPNNPSIKYGEKGFSVVYDFDTGNFVYDKKRDLITLTSLKYNWRRSFSISYSAVDSIISLRASNNH